MPFDVAQLEAWVGAACWALVAVAVAVLGPRSGGAVLEELQETEAPRGRRFSRRADRSAVAGPR